MSFHAKITHILNNIRHGMFVARRYRIDGRETPAQTRQYTLCKVAEIEKLGFFRARWTLSQCRKICTVLRDRWEPSYRTQNARLTEVVLMEHYMFPTTESELRVKALTDDDLTEMAAFIDANGSVFPDLTNDIARMQKEHLRDVVGVG